MKSARGGWALLRLVLAVAVMGEAVAVAAESPVLAGGHVVADGTVSKPYPMLMDECAMGACAGPCKPCGPFPPIRLVSYPKAACAVSPLYCMIQGVAWRRDATSRTFAVRIDRQWEEVYEQLDPLPDPPMFIGRDFTDALAPALGTSDIDSCLAAGGRALIGYRLGNWWGLEVSYLKLTDYSGAAAVANNDLFVEQQFDAFGAPLLNGYGLPEPGTSRYGSLFSPFSDFGDPPILGLDFNNRVAIDFTSSMYDIQWNFRRSIEMTPSCLQMSVLVGGRYMNIDETFNYHSESLYPVDPTTNDVAVATSNDMLGVQVGALFEFQVEPCCRIDTEIKGMVFNNHAGVENSGTVVEEVVGMVPTETTFAGSRDRHCVAWGLELDLSLSWQLTSWLTGRAGYQALWLEGVALGSENFQSDINLLTHGPVQLAHDGRIVYHGPHLGVSAAW